MQVDLATVATPVIVKGKKKSTKKVVEDERPVHAEKSIKSIPEKVKKPPTEKQLAARERMKAARILKLEEAKEAKEKLEKEILDKQKQVDLKKAELLAKRKQKREQKRAIVKPTITSGPNETAPPPVVNPTISEVLEELKPIATSEPRVVKIVEPTIIDPSRSTTPEPVPMARSESQRPPNAPIKAVRYFNYPYGRNVPIQPRFR